MMKNLLTSRLGIFSLALTPLLLCGVGKSAEAMSFVGEIDLLTGSSDLSDINDYASFVNAPAINGLGAYETVLKINFAPGNNIDDIDIAKFTIEYDGIPQDWTVNIGDSQSNNGHKGDAAHQSNDAEMQIVNNNMSIFSNDFAPAALPNPLESISNFVAEDSIVSLYIKDEFLGWGDESITFQDLDATNSISSPYLYALNGQSDYEGPVNYDIYAAFNRVISNTNRKGTGVKNVTICLADESSIDDCDDFTAVPEPSVLFGLVGFGLLGLGSKAKSKAKKSS